MLPLISNDLPTNIERAALHALAYLVFQLPGFTTLPVSRNNRELLPHVFNLTCALWAIGGVLSVALSII